jgi:hypothetical protein
MADPVVFVKSPTCDDVSILRLDANVSRPFLGLAMNSPREFSLPSAPTPDEVILAREAFWKRILLTRGDFGFNRN